MVLRPWFLPILIIVACTASLGQTPAAASKAQPAVPNVVLTEQDNGRDVDLSVGTDLLVKLPSNPSTGYNWSIAGDPSPLKLEKASFRKSTTKAKVVGASGTAVFRLTANSSGLATLTLVYRRSWEYNIPPIKTFAVRVDVR